jgi:hypothetical protein
MNAGTTLVADAINIAVELAAVAASWNINCKKAIITPPNTIDASITYFVRYG